VKVKVKQNHGNLVKGIIYDVLGIEICIDGINLLIPTSSRYDNYLLSYAYGDIFEIVENDISGWSVEKFYKSDNFGFMNISYTNIAPKEINYQNFISDLAETYDVGRFGYERSDMAREAMVKACGIYGHIELELKDYERIFSDFNVPNLPLGEHIGEGYVMCPKCYYAFKADNSNGVFVCSSCQTKFNNPLAKRVAGGVKFI